jgi:hypothetical protein
VHGRDKTPTVVQVRAEAAVRLIRLRFGAFKGAKRHQGSAHQSHRVSPGRFRRHGEVFDQAPSKAGK